MKNIAGEVGSDSYLTTMNRGIIAAGLTEYLSGAGPFTMFAPTNIAFGEMASGVFINLEKPEHKAQMAKLLSHHVVEGKICFNDLKHGQKLKTINGRDLYVTVKEGVVCINSAKLGGRGMESSNGMLHSLDTVIYMS